MTSRPRKQLCRLARGTPCLPPGVLFRGYKPDEDTRP
jgi:hypothetical protein